MAEKMTPLTEVLIVFGTQRPKEEKEGPNKEESDLINGLNIAYNAMTFINKYCKKYGVECIAAAEHNDEKTKHWHIFLQITTTLIMLALGERKKRCLNTAKDCKILVQKPLVISLSEVLGAIMQSIEN